MMSVEKDTPGTAPRIRSTNESYASRVYPRRMRASIVLEPLCAGMCSCRLMLGCREMTCKVPTGRVGWV